MPVIFDTEDRLLKVLRHLEKLNIYPRRYFYPSLHSLDIFDSESLPVSENIARTIVCLPMYNDLSDGEICKIASLIKDVI